MEIAIRKIGNGRGVVLPKPLLAEAGLEERSIAHIAVENGTSVPSKPSKAGGAGRGGDTLPWANSAIRTTGSWTGEARRHPAGENKTRRARKMGVVSA
ncbi:AbrB/MazE/SpoVT family DNA-binding domain-containing protein [Xylophilus ampelinus]|uniref:SpoVT-AbrB domain-containing protein n=1 Tax=Xylophilus ampelinus TaxID=54067 RepID=A0A318SM69_9BURK|nr:hypothetical protein [Xylophilus ampelinus]MCS4509246.1 hypothetical protein [Xylophilus ampelinus]PYE79728.1 hypothetical protein DFQ15_10147 [Xylophilus ampelinus]